MLTRFILLALSAYQVSAFPSHLSEAFLQKRSGDPIQVDSPCPHMAELAKRDAVKGSQIIERQVPPFNAAQQYVSNQGLHSFVAPGPTDQRGPCKRLLIKVELKSSHISL